MRLLVVVIVCAIVNVVVAVVIILLIVDVVVIAVNVDIQHATLSVAIRFDPVGLLMLRICIQYNRVDLRTV